MISIITQKISNSVKLLLDELDNKLLPHNLLVSVDDKCYVQNLSYALNSSEMVLLVGDTTYSKSTYALTTHSALIYDSHASDSINKYCKLSNMRKPPQYLIDSYCIFPENFISYSSMYGYECGSFGEYNKVKVFIIPNSIDECRYLFDNYIVKQLQFDKEVNNSAYIKLFGLSRQQIVDFMSSFNSSLQYTCDTDDTLDTLLIIKFDKKASASVKDNIITSLYKHFYNYIYADENVSLEQMLVDLLTLYHKYVSVAESITGGMISSKIVDIKGASKVLLEGLVTYSNEAKSARLNINPHLIDQFGAVSSEVAYEMSVGLLQSHTDFAICTTGYAGPASSQAEEVGLCYISVGTKQSINVYKYKFCGNREQIRKISTNTALFLLVKLIKDKKF